MNVANVNEIDLVNLIVQVTPNERKAIQWLRFHGLLYREMYCDDCGTELVEKIDNGRPDGRLWRCSNGKCRKRVNIRKDSFFEGSKLKMMIIIRLMYFWAWNARIKDVERDLKINKNTIVDWFNFCRDICAYKTCENIKQIGGPGKIVEIDESKFKKAKYNRGRNVGANDGWVLGGIERGTRMCFLEEVASRDSATLIPIIRKWVAAGKTIMTDEWRAYAQLLQFGFIHQTVNHCR